MTSLLHGGALALYVAAGLVLGFSFMRDRRDLPPRALWVTAAGAAVHVAALAAYGVQWQQLPLAGIGPVLSSLGLLIAIGSVAIAKTGRAGPTGLVLVPCAALLTGAALAFGVKPLAQAADFAGVWFALHVVLAAIGYVGLTIAFAAGSMYLLQFRELKNKHFGAVFRFFPPLDTLDRLGGRALTAGFVALTLALLVGWGWTARSAHSMGPGNPQVIWGVVTWLVFAAALLSRTRGSHRGYRGALSSVLGFVVVVIAFLVLRLQLGGGGAFL